MAELPLLIPTAGIFISQDSKHLLEMLYLLVVPKDFPPYHRDRKRSTSPDRGALEDTLRQDMIYRCNVHSNMTVSLFCKTNLSSKEFYLCVYGVEPRALGMLVKCSYH